MCADTITALAVHVASALDEEQAVSWLLGINEFTLEQYNNSRRILGISHPGKRNSQETVATDIVRFIQEGNTIKYKFVIEPLDLFKIPGLSRDCLELSNFQLGIKLTKSAIIRKTLPSRDCKSAGNNREVQSKSEDCCEQANPEKNNLNTKWVDEIKRKKLQKYPLRCRGFLK